MDESWAESFRVLFGQTKHHWQAIAAGWALSVLAWGLFAIGLTSPPFIYMLAGLAVTVLVAMFLAFHDVRVRGDKFAARLEPKFEFLDNHDACYQVGENEIQGKFQTRKIVVLNAGGTSIEGVRVSLIKIQPDDDSLTQIMPLPLRPQHLNDFSATDVFSLAPGEPMPIGVFGVNSKTPDFLLYHVVQGARNRIRGLEGDDYTVHIQATGQNVAPVTRTARIARDADGHPTLRLIS